MIAAWECGEPVTVSEQELPGEADLNITTR
jgi:hypothetical protein